MYNAWLILKGKKPKGWKGASARRKITPPKSRWNPEAFRLPSFRDHPMYNKLRRITGMGTNIDEILDYFDEVGVFENSKPLYTRELLEDRFAEPEWSEQDKFETLDYLLGAYLEANNIGGRTLGSAGGINMVPREVGIQILEGTEGYALLDDYIDYGKIVREENPVSVTNFAKDKEQSLYDYILPRIGNENNIKSKFENNFLGPHPKVKVTTFFSEEEGQLPDGIADTMIGLLRGGRHFGYMIMNSDGKYVRGKKRTAHLMEREKPFPVKPHANEKDWQGKGQRWENFPDNEKDAGFWGWQQQLEDTGEDTGSSLDWTVTSVVKQGKISGSKEGRKKWYINFVAVFHGRDPKFWAGLKVVWDDTYESEQERTQLSGMLNPEIKDWRKW